MAQVFGLRIRNLDGLSCFLVVALRLRGAFPSGVKSRHPLHSPDEVRRSSRPSYVLLTLVLLPLAPDRVMTS